MTKTAIVLLALATCGCATPMMTFGHSSYERCDGTRTEQTMVREDGTWTQTIACDGNTVVMKGGKLSEGVVDAVAGVPRKIIGTALGL